MLKPLLFALLLCSTSALGHTGPADRGWQHLRLSPTGRYLLLDRNSQPGLYLVDLDDNSTTLLAAGQGTAMAAGWSRDERYVTFKRFSAAGQIPCLFDVQTRQIHDLCPPAERVGIPHLINDSLIVFTIGRRLFVTDTEGRVRHTLDLPIYCNQTPVSADGRLIAFTDADDQLGVIERNTGHIRMLTDDNNGYFSPQWSPAREALLAHTLDGRVAVYDFNRAGWHDLGPGRHATWQEKTGRVLLSKISTDEQGWFKIEGLYSSNPDGSDGFFFTSSADDYVTAGGNLVLYTNQYQGTVRQISSVDGLLQKRADRSLSLTVPPLPATHTSTFSSSAAVFDMPYVHQTFDTPDWFNGSSACGGAAAVMCLAYYGLLSKWPVTVSSPTSHTSDFGRYICETYTYKGTTFDIPGTDPNGNTAYGAFGFIIQHNWQNTKEYMAEYARRHSLSSSVDWSPSRSKFKLEIDSKTPLVVLTSLTSAGHYVSGIGYEQDATSLIFNDPWGNKNLGYRNYEGRRAVYDWPGFSNGHSSLETVHCFIYFRGRRSDLAPGGMIKSDTTTLRDPYTFTAHVFNSGNSSSEATSASVVLSTNASYDSTDLLLLRFALPALKAADTLQIQQTVQLPDTVLSGTYAFGVMIDDANRNLEMNKSNNFAYSRLTVVGRPKVFNVSPLPGSQMAESRPLISAFYNDRVSPLDLASVRIQVDGQDVTAASQVNAAFFNYQPPALSPGEHQVTVAISNKAGYANTGTWSFFVSPAMAVENTLAQPQSYTWQAFPNPFNDQVTITTDRQAPQPLRIRLYDRNGRLVRTIEPHDAAAARIVWDGRDEAGRVMASGLYFCHITAGRHQQTLRLVLLR